MKKLLNGQFFRCLNRKSINENVFNYKLFVTKQEIGEKDRIEEIGLRWDINLFAALML